MAASSVAQTLAPVDLANASIEDLMNIEVTSVSKKEQKVSKTGAAIYVITQTDIRHSGATNIPDLLRMAPGVDVAQVDANTYAISIRGLKDRLADKVLVLIDGRSVYTPTTSGVYWDQQDVPLDDIDRIEIIRGPGGTVWGANAVNGVINIITKNAKATNGSLVTARGGSQNSAGALVQEGGALGTKGAYRVFGNYSNIGSLTASTGGSAADGWHLAHGGFRADWDLTPRNTLTLEGDLMRTRGGQTISVTFSNSLPNRGTFDERVTSSAGNLLGRWNHQFANGSDTSLQVYYDRYTRNDLGVVETLNTTDVDFHHHVALGPRNDVVWGGGYRVTSDDHVPGYGKTYVPLSRTTSLFNTFFQDEIRLTGSLSLTLGTKFEHNAYTGFEFEPSAQVVWTPTSKQTVWASASKAIVQPSREQSDLRVDLTVLPLAGGGFGVLQLTGNPNLKAEQLRDVEAGYRTQITSRFSLDVATFWSFYHNFRTNESDGSAYFILKPAPPHLVIPLTFQSNGRAHTYGAEVFANLNVTRRWRLSPGLNGIHMATHEPPASDLHVAEVADNTPQHQIQIHSFVNVTRRIDWDAAFYHVGRLRNGGLGPVPAFNRMDTRLAWRAGEYLEFSIVGQNLFTPRHAEFHDAFEIHRTLIERSVFAKVTWRR